MGRDYPAVHFFSPLPPMPTDVANHSALVLKAVNQLHPVLAWTNQKDWTRLPGCEVRHFDLHNVPVAELSANAISFYNIGNHPPFHAPIWEVSRRAPGIMILHDSCLQHMFHGLSATDAGCAVYKSLMRRFYGPQGEASALALLRGQADILDLARLYPLTQAVTDGSLGVITHNETELPRLRRLSSSPVWYVPLVAGTASTDIPPVQRGQCDRLKLIVFGHLGANRRVREILAALATSPVRERYRLDIYGKIIDQDAIEAVVAEHRLADQVMLHGYVPAAQLDEALAHADLALNLRFPTMGEASGSQLRIWASGLPSLVTRVGWYAGLSPDCVGFVRHSEEAADIQAHLMAFATDPEPYLRKGRAGRDRVDQHHGANAYAAALLGIAAEVAAVPSVRVWGLPTAYNSPDTLLEGSADEVSGDWIVGWARVCEEGGGYARVRALVGDRVIADAVAKEYRHDVKLSGRGDGYCGFILRVPISLPHEEAARLRVVASAGDAQLTLLEDDATRIERLEEQCQPPAKTMFMHVTDLIVFAVNSPTVSGIQRVQLGYLVNWLAVPERRARIRFAAYSAETRQIHEVASAEVIWLMDCLSLKYDDYPNRRERLLLLLADMTATPPLAPAAGDTLVGTGSFWSFPGMLVALRRLQAASGLRYVQLYYDGVPAFAPETCPAPSVRDYNRSLVHILDQADAVFAISHSSAGELRLLATRLGSECPPIAVVPMGTEAGYSADHADLDALPPGLGDFVLCVGTIEPRKNGLYLFNLWRRLVGRTANVTPKLVCVGRFGWLTEALQHHLLVTANLDGAFVVMPDVSDAQLRALYRACRFTIYPSTYEGWGLPVSESLSAGKLCVTSNVTAMPEAGGRWAVYLDPFDLNDGFSVVAALLDDPDLVRAKEAEIRQSFRATTWGEAADTVWQRLETMSDMTGGRQRRLYRPPVIGMRGRHGLQPRPPASSPMDYAREEAAGILFAQILYGAAWHPPEHWGAWANGPIARLEFLTETVEDDEVTACLQVGLPAGCPSVACVMWVNGAAVSEIGLSAGVHVICVPIGRGGQVRVDAVLDREVTARDDNRRLGLGLHCVFVCRAGDLAGRLEFLESSP